MKLILNDYETRITIKENEKELKEYIKEVLENIHSRGAYTVIYYENNELKTYKTFNEASANTKSSIYILNSNYQYIDVCDNCDYFDYNEDSDEYHCTEKHDCLNCAVEDIYSDITNR